MESTARASKQGSGTEGRAESPPVVPSDQPVGEAGSGGGVAGALALVRTVIDKTSDELPDLLMFLTTENVAIIQRQLEKHPDGLGQLEFVDLLLSCLQEECTPLNQLGFVVQAIELFRQVDVSGDGSATWRELSAFIEQVGCAALGMRRGPLTRPMASERSRRSAQRSRGTRSRRPTTCNSCRRLSTRRSWRPG